MTVRGMTTAAGFVLDVPAIGEEEARRRVLARWSSSSTLHALADGRWLLLLGTLEQVRAERSPGVPVGAGLEETRHGERVTHATTGLQRLDPARWLTITQPVVSLCPLDAPPAPPVEVERPAPVQDEDLQRVAKVGSRSEAVQRLLEPARDPKPRRHRGVLAKLLLRTPARDVVSRQHTKYLDQLVSAFQRKDYENALRDAIGLGGDDLGSWLSLRLPSRRTGPLAPTAQLGGARGSLPWGDSAFTLLTQLYREAAEQLERDGEIERAAYVHADLLRAPRDAVAVLERHGRLPLAARLAEGRDLDPGLVVRLWWRAGDRERALAVARARNAFAAAVERVEAGDDTQLAFELRTAWVESERSRGDRRAAIDAAWPDERLRAGIGEDLDAIGALGGRSAATALGLGLAWREDAQREQEALTLLESGDAGARLALLEQLAERPAADKRADRRLTGAAVRALLRDAAAERIPAARDGRAAFQRLRERADPLLRADLPPLPSSRAAASDKVDVAGAVDRGAFAVSDAVWLPSGVFVAAGERGLLRLTADGRTAQHWDLAAEGLVVADHGGTLLVAGPGEGVTAFHRLDVAGGRLTPWTSLPRTPLPQSYDGGVLIVPGPTGLEGIDTTSSAPRVLWSEVGSDARILDFARSAESLSAIVDVALAGRRGARNTELWTWQLPARSPFRRDVHTEAWSLEPSARTSADGTVVWREDTLGYSKPINRPAQSEGVPGDSTYAVSGAYLALVEPGNRQEPSSELTIAGVLTASFHLARPPALRVHDDVATVWVPDGRVVCVDLVARSVLANLRVG